MMNTKAIKWLRDFKEQCGGTDDADLRDIQFKVKAMMV